ncbi:MAG: PEP-CTERM sorting domain-containing protein [Pirellula sp.]
MKKILCALLAFCAMSAMALESRAAIVSELLLVERTPFVVGTPTVIDIILQETRDPSDSSILGTFETVSGNILFNWTGSSAYVVSGLTDYGTQNGRFFDNGGGSSTIDLDTTARYGAVEQNDLTPSTSDDPLGVIVSPTLTTIRLASFTLSGGAVGDVISFTMSDFDTQLDDIVLADGTVLDGTLIYGSLMITGSSGGVVPEPTSVALFGSLLGGLLVRLRKRPKQA